MKFNEMTHTLSLIVLAITAVYMLIYSGLTGILLTSAVALITAAFIDQFELVIGVAVLFAVVYTLFLKKYVRKLEGFQGNQDIINRVSAMQSNYKPASQSLRSSKKEPAGVYDPAIEGFEDVQPMMEKEGASQESSSASTMNTTNQVAHDMAAEVTSAVNGASDKQIEKEDFESATNTLFKEGKLPSEHAEGPKLDPAETLKKTMKSFDPKTIASMSADTKELLKTQEGLMNMLTQMRPIMADGKELLSTFSGMFGGNMGGGSGMPFKL